jgi:hypothetical protein
MSEVHAHKLWLLAIFLITPGFLFIAVRFGGLTLERLRPWGALFGVVGTALFIAFLVMNDRRADFGIAFLLSILIAMPCIERFEPRFAKKPAP